jgi:hypothetical protein
VDEMNAKPNISDVSTIDNEEMSRVTGGGALRALSQRRHWRNYSKCVLAPSASPSCTSTSAR